LSSGQERRSQMDRGSGRRANARSPTRPRRARRPSGGRLRTPGTVVCSPTQPSRDFRPRRRAVIVGLPPLLLRA
jgi:hypothetical protein